MDHKIILKNKKDLLNLTISQIMNTKIYNFQGPYFNQLYQEALKLEQIENQNQRNISKNTYNIQFLQFEINYISEVKFIFTIVWPNACYYRLR